MKAIKLDASFEEARKIAECFVGSETENGTFFGIDNSNIFILDSFLGYGLSKNITIPIDTAKFCPFVAMRNGVNVYVKKPISLKKGCGFIVYAEKSHPNGRFAVEGISLLFLREHVSIDLEWASKQPGCEIVEVEV